MKPGILSARIRLIEGTGAVGERWLVLTAVSLPSGVTALRADVQVLWLRPRDAIRGRVRVVRVTVDARGGSGSRFVVSARPRVAATMRLLNSLAPARPSAAADQMPGIPGDGSPGVPLTSAGAGPGRTCHRSRRRLRGVTLSLRGKPRQPALRSPNSGITSALERALGRKHLLAP